MSIGVGIAERFEFDSFRPDIVGVVDCVELMTNGREADDLDWLESAHRAYAGKRIHLHSTALSIASAELDSDEVAHAAQLCKALRPTTVSDHLSFRTAGDVHLENFVPPLLDETSRDVIRSNIERTQDACGLRFDLENVTHLLGDKDQLFFERDFLMELCADLGCGMVFDVNNLFIDAQNFGFDPEDYLDGLDVGHVGTIHIAGFTLDSTGQLVDTHMERISEEVLRLLATTLERMPHDIDIILERDNGSATREEILSELRRIDAVTQAVDEPLVAASCGRCSDCARVDSCAARLLAMAKIMSPEAVGAVPRMRADAWSGTPTA